MKSFKKVLCLLVSVLMLAALTGCGGGEKKEAAKEGGKTVVTFWHVYSKNFGAPVIKKMVEDFNKSQDKILVKEVYNPDMYPGLMKNLQADVAAGKSPSIAMIGYNYLKYFDQNFKYVSPLDVEKTSDKDKDFVEKNFLPNVLSLAKDGDKQVGLPFSISAPILYYNPDLFKAAGLDPNKPPKTWAEVKNYAKAIHDKTGDYGFYMQEYQDNWATQGLLTSNGAQILSKDNKAVFASPESVEAYQLYADMVLKDKSALHIAADEGIASFYSGKVGMLMGTSAKIGTVTKSSKFNVMACTFPAFGTKKVQIPSGGNFLAITAQNKEEQKAAWEFIKFIMQPKYLAQWTINTGYLPPRQDVVDDASIKEAIAKTPALKIAFEELPMLSQWVAFPGDVGVKAEKRLADARDQILSGQDPMTVLQKAQDDLNALLK
ncbi:MAG: ABC transporter substrate-binding protein [Acidaminococcus sp.]|nr:ABC transporter substrate-binding protein [Acidaminococcus sp.]MCI2101000.1 ABC transporter substrate-binding protein [Acidaminococcus sp.]MCI2117682.1 ABC transporter substrate-binding protein [Acidaminococcus sp.]